MKIVRVTKNYYNKKFHKPFIESTGQDIEIFNNNKMANKNP